jgi:Transcriptional regulator, AbiEi antitoxin
MSVGGGTLCDMVSSLPPTLRNLAQRQYGVVSRSQAIRAGLSPDMIKFRVTSGRWQQLHLGVYATFSGIPGRGARLWAALLAAGPDAVLSHQTAAELHGLSDKPASPIHVSIPRDRHLVTTEGVRLHRSAWAADAVQQGSRPPRTTVEETVLDLTQTARSFDDVCGWVTRAIARELTDQASLQAAMKKRSRLRWRADLHELLGAAAAGDHSVLEFRYHRDVERAHGLPAPDRQVPFIAQDGRRGRRDRVYQEYDVVVELDGRLAHPAENRWKDKARDNAAAAGGQQSLRYDWAAVTRRPCATAAEVAEVLRHHGWQGWPRPCSPGCPVQRSDPQARPEQAIAGDGHRR